MTFPKDTYQTLTVERIRQHILKVVLDRPSSSNAMNTQMGIELMELFGELQINLHGFRCVLLTGAGDKAFCAGGDLKERNGMTDLQWQSQHAIYERMIRAVMGSPIPVIAGVNGAAYGGGCELAAACDFIYASANARFALPEVKLGIMPGAGGTQNLPRSIGAQRAKELTFTGRPFSAQDAASWGFVNQVVDSDQLVEQLLATAQTIADNAPISVRQIKQSISSGLQMSIRDGLTFEIEAYNRLVPTQDRREGVLAYNEKRKPSFKGQ